MGKRPKKVREALRREISMIIQNEIKDPRLGFTTITRVEISNDLRNAQVYYTVLNEKEKTNTKHALSSAEGYIKKLIGDRIKMKFVPEITFRLDKSAESTRRVHEILDELKKEERPDEYGESDKGDKGE